MFSQPAPVITVNPDLFHALVRKMIRDIARGSGDNTQAASNQTLAMFARINKKINKFIQPRIRWRSMYGIVHPHLFHAFVLKMIRDIVRGDGRNAPAALGNHTLAMLAATCRKFKKLTKRRLDRRFYSGRPHHPRFDWPQVTCMKDYRKNVIDGLRVMIKGLAPTVTTVFGDLPKHGYGMESIVQTDYIQHGRVWVQYLAPSLLNVRVFSVKNWRFIEQIQFLVYITFDTQGRYVVVDNIHGKRITRLDFHQLLRKRITDAFKRGDCPLA
jgi:hypothetical protein